MAHALAEAELIFSIVTFFKKVGITSSDVRFKVSSQKVLQELLRSYSVPKNSFGRVCVEKIPVDVIKKDLMTAGMSDLAVEELLQVLAIKSLDKSVNTSYHMMISVINVSLEDIFPFNSNYDCHHLTTRPCFIIWILYHNRLCLTVSLEVLGGKGDAITDLKQLFFLAEKIGYSDRIEFDASIVRGLAYYTGIVFEGFDREGKLGAICGGGWYDKLLSTFGGEDLPAFGFGFGDAVIVELLKEKGRLPELNHQVVSMVCALDSDLQGAAAAVATKLREKGESVDLILGVKPLKWVFKRAARINAERLILVGPDEWQKGTVSVKNLSSEEQYEVKFEELE
ncbi:hypothetical protein MLD38_021590 [Melastoma candidum]|uniref:Uncharacterized protein n=1 Tax=Melastoma candidum TaxID=119954 RepID=A0ACB9QGF5_9MYRT|nr:hypothetical protein MLD38_021590 [Melastoma candidum]